MPSDFDEKTRVTQVIQGKLDDEPGGSGNDCLVVIYTKEPNLLGKRYVCGVCEATVLVTKAGDGELLCHDQPMEVAQAKPLPSSD